MRLTSPAFADKAVIPSLYTCQGRSISPPLGIADIPPETVSLALIMHDPDAPSGDFLHWILWNIPRGVSFIEENSVPADAAQGINGFGKPGYGGPCPPSGTHRYIFELYALDALIDMPENSDRSQIEAALSSHSIVAARLTGLCSAS